MKKTNGLKNILTVDRYLKQNFGHFSKIVLNNYNFSFEYKQSLTPK